LALQPGHLLQAAGHVSGLWIGVRSQDCSLNGAWLRERRSAVLVVQSVVVRRQGHVLLNPQHPDLHRITSTAPEPVLWDARLYGRH